MLLKILQDNFKISDPKQSILVWNDLWVKCIALFTHFIWKSLSLRSIVFTLNSTQVLLDLYLNDMNGLELQLTRIN